MKKAVFRMLFTYFTVISTVLINAQSIVVNSPNPTIVVGTPDADELEVGIEIANISPEQKDIKVRRTVLISVDSTSNYFCWSACYISSVSVSTNPLTINGDSTLNNTFTSHYRPFGHAGISEIQYTFFDANNPTDSANVVVRYEISPVGISNISNVTSLKAFPNPADDKVTLSFSRNSDKHDGVIELYNMLGTKVYTQSVNELDGSISISTENFKAGLYFYSMNEGGEISRPGRLTIKH